MTRRIYIKTALVVALSFVSCGTPSQTANRSKYQSHPPYTPIKLIQNLLEISYKGNIVNQSAFRKRFHVSMRRDINLPNVQSYLLKKFTDWYFDTSLWISQNSNHSETYELKIALVNEHLSRWNADHCIDEREATNLIESYGWKSNPTRDDFDLPTPQAGLVPNSDAPKDLVYPPLPPVTKSFARLNGEKLVISPVGQKIHCINFIGITGLSSR